MISVNATELRRLEDAYWIEKAKQAEKEGFIGIEESMKFIQEATGAETDSEIKNEKL